MSQQAMPGDWAFPVPVSFGSGRINELPAIMKAKGAKRPLVVTDKGGDRHGIAAMLERGGLEYFEDLAIRRSNLLYELIDSSGGFYNCFVNQQRFRSRMQVVFTIGDG